MPSLYASVPFSKGKTVLSGLKPRLYFISKSDIVNHPVVPKLNDAASQVAAVTATGDFTLAADAKFKYIEIDNKKSSLETSQQGEKPSVTWLNKLNVKHNDTDENIAGFAALSANDDLLYLAPTASGKYRIVGHPDFVTNTKVDTKSGESVTAEGGTTIEVEAPDLTPAPFYTGKIVTAEGEISAS